MIAAIQSIEKLDRVKTNHVFGGVGKHSGLRYGSPKYKCDNKSALKS